MSLMASSLALINRFKQVSAENSSARALARELKNRAQHLSDLMQQVAQGEPQDVATMDNMAIILGQLTLQIYCIESALAINDVGTLVDSEIMTQARKVVADFDLVFSEQTTKEPA